MIDDSSVTHVTDTAFWVAHFRAKESQRAAPAFLDPLASLLCGNRGSAIARSIPRAAMVEWGIVMRTSAIDRLLDFAGQSTSIINTKSIAPCWFPEDPIPGRGGVPLRTRRDPGLTQVNSAVQSK
jgi:hypothetical protein